MAPKKKESRRPYGRPKEAPGPVQTYEGSFQIPPVPQSDSSHHTLRLSQSGQLVSSSIPSRRQRPRPEREQAASGDTVAGSLQHDAASAPARVHLARTRQADDVLPEAGPSKRRRPSIAAPAGGSKHRQTHSAPTMPVAHTPGSDLQRSSSSTVLQSEMAPDVGGPLAGPRSWPRTLVHPPTGPHPYARPSALSPITPISPLAYRGGHLQALSTPGSNGQGEYSPLDPPSSNWGDTSSTGSLPLTPRRMLYPRAESHELPDLSPIETTAWQYPMSAPHTPGSGSLRALSLPPTSASPSPNLGMVGDFDFDFDLPPGLGSGSTHASDLAPLPPDQFPPHMMLAANTVYSPPAVASRQAQASLYGQQYPQGSMSGTLSPPPHPLMNRQGLPGEAAAPDLSGPFYFPENLFGDGTVFAFNGVQDDYAHSVQGFGPAAHSAPGYSGTSYYTPAPAQPYAPDADSYMPQAGPSYSPPAGPSYSPSAGPSYSPPAGPSYSPPAGYPYSSQGGPPYASEAGPSYSSQGSPYSSHTARPARH